MAPNLTQGNLSSLKFARNNISSSKSLEMIYFTDFCVTSYMFHHKYKDKSFSGVNCETCFPVKQVFLRNELSYERHGIFAAGGGQMPTQEKKSFPTNELPCQTESLILPIPA